MLRINAIGTGRVGYLLEGSGCLEHEHAQDGPGHELPGRARGVNTSAAAEYMLGGVEHGERAGVWHGQGTAFLGIESGKEATKDEIRAVFGELKYPGQDGQYLGSKPREFKSYAERLEAALAREPEASDDRRREIADRVRGDGRRPVAYYDFTFSPAKSVSVYYAAALAAGDHERAAAILTAHDEAVRTALDMAEEHAYVRTGHHGRAAAGRSVGKYEKAEGLAVALFPHSTSRESEPQIHTHAAVLNRARTISDGKVRALDGASWRPVKEELATAYETAIEQNLTRALGIEFGWRADGVAREILGVDVELMREASTRRAQVIDHVQPLVEKYREQYGHEPPAHVMASLNQKATLASRKPKEGPQGPAAVLEWAQGKGERLAGVLGEVAAAAERVQLEGHPEAGRTPATREETIRRALEDVQAQYPAWTVGNLVAALDRQVHEVPDGAERMEYLRDLAQEATSDPAHGVLTVALRDAGPVPGALLREEDARPVWRPHVDEQYTTAAHLDTERRILTEAAQPGAPAVAGPAVELLRVEAAAAGLSDDQAAAVAGILSSGKAGDVLIGPAGAGKSRTMDHLGKVWTEQTGGRVIGLAPSQRAAEELAADGVPTTANTARFLVDVEAGRADVRAGDLVIVDEAGMASTDHLSQISTLAREAGAKLLYVGDHAQLAAVGAGGMLEMLAERGTAYELETVRRFKTPAGELSSWEGEASLQLRQGDVRALDAYEAHGRLYGGAVEEMTAAAARGFLADTLAGKSSLLVVPTNQQATELSKDIQASLIARGRVDAAELIDLGDRTTAHVGDVIQVRKNGHGGIFEGLEVRDRNGVRLWDGKVANRARYTVRGMDDEGRLVCEAEDGSGTAHLPAEYVEEHTALAYAVTTHAAQGATVDTCREIVDADTSRRAAYVGLTRGQYLNEAYVVTDVQADEHDPNEREVTSARDVLAGVLENIDPDRAALARLREVEAESDSLHYLAAQWDLAVREGAGDRYADELLSHLGAETMDELAAEPGYQELLSELRRVEMAGHDSAAVVEAITTGHRKPLTEGAQRYENAANLAAVLRYRVEEATAGRQPERDVTGADWATLAPEVAGAWGEYAQTVAERANERVQEIGRQAVEEAPAWAVEALGEVPEYEGDRAEWQRRAGAVGAWREYAGLEDGDALGTAPARDDVLARILWQDAHTAVGTTADGLELAAASDGELRAMLARYEREATWAPADVAQDLAQARQLAAGYEQDVVLFSDDLARMNPDHDHYATTAERLGRTRVLAEHFTERAQLLADVHAGRAAWNEQVEPVRTAAELARVELERRGALAEPEQPALFDLPDTAEDETLAPANTSRGVEVEADPATVVADVDAAAREVEAIEPTAAQDEALFELTPAQVAGAAPVQVAPAESEVEAPASVMGAVATAVARAAQAANKVALAAEAEHARRVQQATEEGDVRRRETEREQEAARERAALERDRAKQQREQIERDRARVPSLEITRNGPTPSARSYLDRSRDHGRSDGPELGL